MCDCLVSVCMITYNQENFIREAIEGVLMQKTNFEYELIIGEDCSKDKTKDICIEYSTKFSHIIKLISYSQNQGMMRNFMYVVQQSRGKYIAFCEGDDYWIDPFKLQKQIDFLENNLSYGLVYTNVLILSQSTGEETFWTHRNINDTFDELIIENHIPTLSVCCRSCLVQDFIVKFKDEIVTWPFADFPLWLYISTISSMQYFPEVTGIYRLLDKSASHFVDSKKNMRFQRDCCKVIFLMKKQLSSFGNPFCKIDYKLAFIKKYYSWMVSLGDCELIKMTLKYLFDSGKFIFMCKCILLLIFYKVPFLPIRIVKVKHFID